MFSFFRRSKKDIDTASKEKKNKSEKLKSDNGSDSNISKGMCKNISIQKLDNNELQSGNINVMPNNLSEFELCKDEKSSARVTNIQRHEKDENNLIAINGKTDTNFSNESNFNNFSNSANIVMDVRQNLSENATIQPPKVTSYANMVKSDTQQRRSSVKPCGHGTMAITPRIPLPARKIENNASSPPTSPGISSTNAKSVQVQAVDQCVANSNINKNPLNLENVTTSVSRFHKPVTNLNNNLTLEKQNEDNKKNLINQEAKFQSQLNDVSKQLSLRDDEANKLRFQMDELQRDVFAKSAGMDRLQSELQAALKESDTVRQKLRNVEEDLNNFRQKNGTLTEELTMKTERFNDFQATTNEKINELQITIRALKVKIESLEIQLDQVEKEKENLEKQKFVIMHQREEEKKSLDEALEKAIQDKNASQKKWEEDFDKLRTFNMVKEQETLADFEWKLREIEQSCKKKIQEKDKAIQKQLEEACKNAEIKIKQADELSKEVDKLKCYENEAQQLKGLTEEQQKSLELVSHQLEEIKVTEESLRNESKRLRTLIDMEKENLQHIQRMHDRDIQDRERKLKETLDEQKGKIAMYWEERLLQECRRLKCELDQIHYEERFIAISSLKNEKEEEIHNLKQSYDKKIQDCLKEISQLKQSLSDKDEHYQMQVEKVQTNTDRDILELRRVMDKIDMHHHEKFEKLVQEHENELEKINKEQERQLKEVESNWQLQVSSMRATVELVKEQMEKESQNKMQTMIEQHRSELDTQWENLIHQKSEAVRLVEEEYILKYKTLEEQFYTQQKSHENREVELLKAIDTLKNEITSKGSTIDDLQNNVDTLEGGIQVLNQELAYHGETVCKTKMDAEYKIKELQETITMLREQHKKELEEQQSKFHQIQKQSQTSMDYLQRKCQCLNKLFEEVRTRYEKRESREEDINTISDLKRIIMEQEKDLACLNEEKRFFQIKLMNLERFLNGDVINNGEEDEEENNQQTEPTRHTREPNQFNIPPTIPECDDDFEDALT